MFKSSHLQFYLEHSSTIQCEENTGKGQFKKVFNPTFHFNQSFKCWAGFSTQLRGWTGSESRLYFSSFLYFNRRLSPRFFWSRRQRRHHRHGDDVVKVVPGSAWHRRRRRRRRRWRWRCPHLSTKRRPSCYQFFDFSSRQPFALFISSFTFSNENTFLGVSVMGSYLG